VCERRLWPRPGAPTPAKTSLSDLADEEPLPAPVDLSLAAVLTPFGAVAEIRDGLAVRQRFWTDQGKAIEAAGLAE
jgi:hypothetical protein